MDDCTGAAEVVAGGGIDIVEHGGTLIHTGIQIHSELCIFDLAANRDSTRLVDNLAGIVADDLYNLGIAVDGLVDDHKVAFGSAVVGGWDEADTESIVASLNEKVEEGMINISMNTSPNFLNGTSEGNLMIVNESINRYPQVVEIIRNDTGEVIYKSGAIPVGSKIEAAKLSVDLDAGMYECTAMFYNVDPNTGNYLGCAGAIIHLTVVE